MLLSHLCLPALGLLLAGTCSTGSAHAQTGTAHARTEAPTHRPDAEGYPCAAPKLAIVQAGPDFAIRNAAAKPVDAEIKAAVAAVKAGIAVGAALKFDRAVFSAGVHQTQEAADASRR